jgi:hypothetical protein
MKANGPTWWLHLTTAEFMDRAALIGRLPKDVAGVVLTDRWPLLEDDDLYWLYTDGAHLDLEVPEFVPARLWGLLSSGIVDPDGGAVGYASAEAGMLALSCACMALARDAARCSAFVGLPRGAFANSVMAFTRQATSGPRPPK